MAEQQIHIGDAGTTIALTIVDQSSTAVDLSSSTFTAHSIMFQNPAGSTATYTVSAFSGSGTSGVIHYTTTSTTFTTAGSWRMQAKIVIGSNTWYSESVKFRVFPNLT